MSPGRECSSGHPPPQDCLFQARALLPFEKLRGRWAWLISEQADKEKESEGNCPLLLQVPGAPEEPLPVRRPPTGDELHDVDQPDQPLQPVFHGMENQVGQLIVGAESANLVAFKSTIRVF